jgi:hypothetical protein
MHAVHDATHLFRCSQFREYTLSIITSHILFGHKASLSLVNYARWLAHDSWERGSQANWRNYRKGVFKSNILTVKNLCKTHYNFKKFTTFRKVTLYKLITHENHEQLKNHDSHKILQGQNTACYLSRTTLSLHVFSFARLKKPVK